MANSILAQILTAAVPYTGAWQKVPHRNEVNGPAMSWTVQAVEGTSGTVTATVIIDASNDGVNALPTPLGTITLNATSPAIDGFAWTARWNFIRVRVTAMSAASALTVTLGW